MCIECGGQGSSEADYERLMHQRDEFIDKFETVQEELEGSASEISSLQAQVKSLTEDNAELRRNQVGLLGYKCVAVQCVHGQRGA